jgi:hypothetical protein
VAICFLAKDSKSCQRKEDKSLREMGTKEVDLGVSVRGVWGGVVHAPLLHDEEGRCLDILVPGETRAL